MPRTDWKRMRSDLARIADVVGQELREAKVEAKITLGRTPPRIFIAMHYPEELHTAPEPALKRDAAIEIDERHDEIGATFLAASRKVEEVTKRYGLMFFRDEGSFAGADERISAYGFHPKDYESTIT